MEKDNIQVDKESELHDIITFKVTEKEKQQLVAVSKQWQISISELIRNLIRKNLYQFATTENMRKYLRISGEIDMILLEKSIISSRKSSNLNKMFEILTDFEVLLRSQGKNFDYDDHKSWKMLIDNAMVLIYDKDSYLYEQLEPTWIRIKKTKGYKALCANL